MHYHRCHHDVIIAQPLKCIIPTAIKCIILTATTMHLALPHLCVHTSTIDEETQNNELFPVEAEHITPVDSFAFKQHYLTVALTNANNLELVSRSVRTFVHLVFNTNFPQFSHCMYWSEQSCVLHQNQIDLF